MLEGIGQEVGARRAGPLGDGHRLPDVFEGRPVLSGLHARGSQGQERRDELGARHVKLSARDAERFLGQRQCPGLRPVAVQQKRLEKALVCPRRLQGTTAVVARHLVGQATRALLGLVVPPLFYE